MENGKWIGDCSSLICRWDSPLHGAFLGSIDLGQLRSFLEQKPFDVVEKEILCVRAGQIEAVVIDYLRLLLQPRCPAGLADLSRDSLAQFVGQRRKAERRTFLSTMFALNHVCH